MKHTKCQAFRYAVLSVSGPDINFSIQTTDTLSLSYDNNDSEKKIENTPI
jgi:hypothetical protein